MANDFYYCPGDYYQIDDRTGFKIRASRSRVQWNSLVVSSKVYEARQPQDFVRGVYDLQAVPIPRPRQPNTFVEILNGTGQFEVYGDLPGKQSFLVQNSLAYNAGINAASNYTNENGTAQIFVTNGTVLPVTPDSFPSNLS